MDTERSGEAPPIGNPLLLRELPAVAEPVLDERLPRDPGLGAGALQPEAQVEVLTRLEALVEAVLEQNVAREDRRTDTEPVLAAARAVVRCQRASPVARARDTVQTRLQSGIAACGELIEQVLEGIVRKDDIDVDQGDVGGPGSPDSQVPGHGHTLAMVREDASTEGPREFHGSVTGEPVDDDDLGGTGTYDRLQTALHPVL